MLLRPRHAQKLSTLTALKIMMRASTVVQQEPPLVEKARELPRLQLSDGRVSWRRVLGAAESRQLIAAPRMLGGWLVGSDLPLMNWTRS